MELGVAETQGPVTKGRLPELSVALRNSVGAWGALQQLFYRPASGGQLMFVDPNWEKSRETSMFFILKKLMA